MLTYADDRVTLVSSGCASVRPPSVMVLQQILLTTRLVYEPSSY
jgi:hypothetical protein